MRLLVFSLGNQRHGIRIEAVERVVRAVEITPVADAPAGLLGVIGMYGHAIPVFGMREKFRLPGKDIDLSDQLIIARSNGKRVALLVDDVAGVAESEAEFEGFPEAVPPETRGMEGAVRLGGRMVIVDNLNEICAWSAPAATGAA